MSHALSRSTLAALKLRHNGSLRSLARELGFPPHFAATLSDMLREKPGCCSLARENQVRVALGLRPIVRKRYKIVHLALDPQVRAAQLRALLAAAEAETEET